MARFLHRKSVPAVCNRRMLLLAFFWCFGVFSGVWCVFRQGFLSSSVMRGCLYGYVSIVCLLSTLFLPFLLSAFAVFLSGQWLIFPIALYRGFSFSFVFPGFAQCFGCAGQWIWALLCFSDLVSLPLLFWYWLWCLREERRGFAAVSLLVFALLLLIGSADHCLVSPFFADIIN